MLLTGKAKKGYRMPAWIAPAIYCKITRESEQWNNNGCPNYIFWVLRPEDDESNFVKAACSLSLRGLELTCYGIQLALFSLTAAQATVARSSDLFSGLGLRKWLAHRLNASQRASQHAIRIRLCPNTFSFCMS